MKSDEAVELARRLLDACKAADVSVMHFKHGDFQVEFTLASSTAPAKLDDLDEASDDGALDAVARRLATRSGSQRDG